MAVIVLPVAEYWSIWPADLYLLNQPQEKEYQLNFEFFFVP